MKDFNLGKWITRFIILSFLFMVYDTTMNYLDNMYETIINNKSNVDETINSDDFLTMYDLGFEHHKTTNSQVKELDIKIDPNGLSYTLELNNDDKNNYVCLDLTIFRLSTQEIADESFESLVRILYRNDKTFTHECWNGNCVMPNIDYETTIKHMIPLDLNQWNVDRGFALKELFTNDWNKVIIQKDNQIMLLDYNKGSSFDEKDISTFVELFDKTDKIFK